MDHSSHATADHGAHAGHHTEMFRLRFWWSLLLSVPVVATSHMVMDWFGYELDFYGIERSEEHTSELQSLMRISYAVFCLKKKNNTKTTRTKQHHYTCKIQTLHYHEHNIIYYIE